MRQPRQTMLGVVPMRDSATIGMKVVLSGKPAIVKDEHSLTSVQRVSTVTFPSTLDIFSKYVCI